MGELLIVLAIFVLLFGAKRLPDLADGMGKAIRNFKRGLTTADEDVTPAPPEKQVTETSSATAAPKLDQSPTTSEPRPSEKA